MFGYAAPSANPKLITSVFRDAPLIASSGAKFESAKRLSCDVLPARIPMVMIAAQSIGRNPFVVIDNSIAAPAVANTKTL